jgi:hypothetical protein
MKFFDSVFFHRAVTKLTSSESICKLYKRDYWKLSVMADQLTSMADQLKLQFHWTSKKSYQ